MGIIPNKKFVLNFTPTGMIPTKEMTPHVPVSTNEIVDEVKSGKSTSIVRINSYDNLLEKNADLLARNRANACKAYLLIKGVGIDRIQVRITSLQGAERKVTLELW